MFMVTRKRAWQRWLPWYVWRGDMAAKWWGVECQNKLVLVHLELTAWSLICHNCLLEVVNITTLRPFLLQSGENKKRLNEGSMKYTRLLINELNTSREKGWIDSHSNTLWVFSFISPRPAEYSLKRLSKQSSKNVKAFRAILLFCDCF